MLFTKLLILLERKVPNLANKFCKVHYVGIFVFCSIIQWLIYKYQFNILVSIGLNLMALLFSMLIVSVKIKPKHLEESQPQNNLLKELPIALIIVNEKGEITYINHKAMDFCGFSKEFNTVCSIYDYIDKDHLLNFLVQTVKERKNFHEQYFTFQKSDELNYLCLSSTEIVNDQGKTTGAALVAWQISEQAFLGRHLSQGGKLAMIGELAAGTAHEIRNPLTSVKGLIQILSMRFPKNDSVQEYISVMLKEINQINQIITELLLLARRTTPNLSFASLPSVLNNVLVLMEGEASRRGIEFKKNYEKDLPLVVLDEDQIKQVFWHLTSNAIHAMPYGGELTINANYVQVDEIIEITFSDTGMGIRNDNLSRIFQPFFTTRSEGKGLGLPVSYQIVDNHGGKLSVKSIVGKGTTFTVKLPVITYEKTKAS